VIFPASPSTAKQREGIPFVPAREKIIFELGLGLILPLLVKVSFWVPEVAVLDVSVNPNEPYAEGATRLCLKQVLLVSDVDVLTIPMLSPVDLLPSCTMAVQVFPLAADERKACSQPARATMTVLLLLRCTKPMRPEEAIEAVIPRIMTIISNSANVSPLLPRLFLPSEDWM
jgi:hypothetical protein